MSLFSEQEKNSVNDQNPYELRDAEKLPQGKTVGASSKKKDRRKKIVLIVVAALLLLILIAIASCTVFSKAPDVSDEGLIVQPTAVPELSVKTTPEPVKTTPSPEPVTRKKDVYTLLVVGRDRVGMNTDTIMVVSLDCAAHTANVVNIPRDTLVNVPWAVKKINSIYGAEEISGLLTGVENLVGFPIDNYVVINTYVFQAVIDCIGGVWFDVPIYMYYDDPDQDLHISINPGNQLLDGYHAEQVVRFRQNNDGTGYANGDLGRIETQQAFFKALAKQILSLGNIANLPELIDIVTGYTDTDLTAGNIAFYAEEFLKLQENGINFYTMPHENVYIRGGSYVSILLDEWLDMVNTYLNPFSTQVTPANVNIITWSDQGVSSTTGEAPGLDSFYDYYAQ